jgi:hypothetical protein
MVPSVLATDSKAVSYVVSAWIKPEVTRVDLGRRAWSFSPLG